MLLHERLRALDVPRAFLVGRRAQCDVQEVRPVRPVACPRRGHGLQEAFRRRQDVFRLQPSYTVAVTTTPSGVPGLHGWNHLLTDPPGDLDPDSHGRLHELAELGAAWPALAHGDRIVRGDLRADNMVRDHDRGVTFVDWADAVRQEDCAERQ